jgi:hypothetical protein
MQTSRFFALGLGLALAASACSSSTASSQSEAAVTNPPVCPNFVSAAVSSKTTCKDEGYVCGIGFQCGAFFQQAVCTCTGGKFACTTPKGDIAADTSEADVTANFCTAQPPSSEACPKDQTSMQGKACTTAGKSCYYTGTTCQGASAPLTDECDCKNTQTLDGGASSLQWQCSIATCN